MLPTTTALRRRPATRLAILATGYLAATVLGLGGLVAFSTTGDLDALMSRGTVMVAGILIGFGTGELRRASCPHRRPDPSNPATA